MVAPPFPLWAWLVFLGLVLALLILDLFVLHRNAREVTFKEALWLSVFWIAISLAFGGFVWYLAGVEGAEAYLAAYLLEKSLSLDNVFVFSVIFTSFAVPESQGRGRRGGGFEFTPAAAPRRMGRAPVPGRRAPCLRGCRPCPGPRSRSPPTRRGRRLRGRA